MTVQHRFVARQTELSRLEHALEQALSGKGSVLFLSGEAGAGKTTLVNEFCLRAQQTNAEIVLSLGTCDPQTGQSDPYLPFREILGQLTGSADPAKKPDTLNVENSSRLKRGLMFSLEALIEVGPDLVGIIVPGGRILGQVGKFAVGRAGWMDKLKKKATQKELQSELSLASDLNRDQILEQYINVLHSLAQKMPLLLVLDDLHWVDEASADLLFRLGRRLADSRILVIGTYRPEEVAQGRMGERHPLEKVLTELKRYFGDIFIDLDQATATRGREFVDKILDLEPNQLDGSFRQALFLHTGGQPLFTVELLHDFKEKGELSEDSTGRWVAASTIDWSRLPARVEGVIEERIQRLAQGQRELLTLASVEGEVFTAEVIAQIQNEPAREVVRQLSGELQHKYQLVESLDVQRIETQRLSHYRFSHSLLRMYLYEYLDLVERVYQHESVGLALEALYGDQATEIAVQLAHHFEQAEMPDKARAYLKQAGLQAATSFANDTALDYLSRALALTPVTDRQERYELLSARARVYDLLAERSLQRADLDVLAQIAEELADLPRQAAVQLQKGLLARNTGDFTLAVAEARSALDLIGTILEPSDELLQLSADSYNLSGDALRKLGESKKAQQELEHALLTARSIGYKPGEILALDHLGTLSWSQGDFAESRKYHAEALSIAQEIGDQRQEWSILSNLGLIAKEDGEYAQARSYFEQALLIVHNIGDRRGESMVINNLGSISLSVGDYTQSKKRWIQALALMREIQDRAGEGIILANLAEVHRILGDYDQATKQAQLARQLFEETGQRMAFGIVLGNLGQIELARGSNEQARSYLEKSLAIALEVGDRMGEATVLNLLGEALICLNYLEEANLMFARAFDIWRNFDQLPGLYQAQVGMAQVSQAEKAQQKAYLTLDQLDEVLLYLLAERGEQDDLPLSLYLACAHLLHKLDDQRFRPLLSRAHHELQVQADRISDPLDRESFLSNVPENQEIERLFASA
jgi:adenylate cyclase